MNVSGHLNNQHYFEKLQQVMPDGLMSNFRLKGGGFVPTHYVGGEGANIVDMDGNHYIDYGLGSGTMILGHGNPYWQQSIARQAQGFISNEPHSLGLQAAEKLIRHIPCADYVRFACSGTEAVRTALRIARGYTGKNMVVRFNGHYNGGLDELMGGIVNNPDQPIPVEGESESDVFSKITNTRGRARHSFNDYFMLEWNDIDALRELLASCGHDIAAIVMEPIMVNFSGCMPKPGYLESVRELCDQHHIVLIFDEVLTGFRIGLGGAQTHFGVTPDIATFAKALGNGMPVSAFCGKKNIMEVLCGGEVVAGGTYNGHPLSMTAVTATIEELERDNGAAMKRIQDLGMQLGDGLKELINQHQVNLLVQGFPGAWTLAYHDQRKVVSNHAESLGKDYCNKLGLFISLLVKRGVLVNATRLCTSAGHTEADVNEVLLRADDALKEFKATIANA